MSEQTVESKTPPLASEIRLDDKNIEIKTSNYPDETCEPIQWVAAYCRERCARQLSVLVSKCKSLKFDTDYSYWHKIFSGKYFQKDAQGKVQGSVKNLLRIIEALRNRERIEWRAGKPPFIETDTWFLVRDFIDKKRLPGRVNKFGGIVGPTGSQKSACLKEYVLRNNHGKCVHVEAPQTPALSQFISDLAVKLGEARSTNINRKVGYITSTINETKTIIVDNVQRLYKDNRDGDQPIFNFLQKLQDDTECTIILSFTPVFVTTLERGQDQGYFEQFIGRMGGRNKTLVLPAYTTTEDLEIIAKAYGLKDNAANVKYLEKIAREPGRIRALFEDLQDAKILADAENTVLTIDHIREARGEEEQ